MDHKQAEHYEDLEERTAALERLAASVGWRTEIEQWLRTQHKEAEAAIDDLTQLGGAVHIEHSRARKVFIQELLARVVDQPAKWRATLETKA